MIAISNQLQARDVNRPLADGGGMEELRCRKLEAHKMPPSLVECHSFWQERAAPAPVFWPCVGEHPVYDSRMYAFLTGDYERNRLYNLALEEMVPGKVVLDVGTGDCAHWAVAAIRAGALRAYAIEQDRFAAARAMQVIAKLGMTDRITILEGHSNELNLPERVDVCVSEILGEIGSAEGAIEVLNDVRKRMLAQNGSMLPYRCSTLLAPVSLPASIAQQPCFASNAISYLWKIFETWSRPFDVRVSVAEHQNGCKIVAAPQVFEEMVFDSPINSAQTVEAEFTVGEDADIHGFFLWLSLQCAPEAKRLDTLNTETNWFPVFFPIWPQSISVQMGDRIEVTCNRSLSDDGIHPDYEISGSILPRNGSVRTFAWESFHHAQSFRCNGFYRALFGC